jgi:serine/threonine-protein kinase HipA
MDKETLVFVDLRGAPHLVGRLWARTPKSLEDGTASLNLALEVADYFQLDSAESRRIAGEVGTAVAAWRRKAAKLGLAKAEIDRMASAFEHQDLRAAQAGKN